MFSSASREIEEFKPQMMFYKQSLRGAHSNAREEVYTQFLHPSATPGCGENSGFGL